MRRGGSGSDRSRARIGRPVKAPPFWYEHQPAGIARALSPIGALYGACVAYRMRQPGVRVAVPVVCVGNFTLGGAGKTPTAIALAQMLQAAGRRPAFLSRGFGRTSRTSRTPMRVVLGHHQAQQVGDEPLLLARVACCCVGADRVASAYAAMEAGADVLIMDDGLQNSRLEKTLSLAVVDGEIMFGNGLCFPAGPLRAPIAAQIPHVQALVMIGGDAQAYEHILRVAEGRPVFRAALKADALVAARLIGRPVLAFAGIARPEKFFTTLTDIGAHVVERATFPDHWPFRRQELVGLAQRASEAGLIPVCTEKDHVRLPEDVAEAIIPLPVTLTFDRADLVLTWLQTLGA